MRRKKATVRRIFPVKFDGTVVCLRALLPPYQLQIAYNVIATVRSTDEHARLVYAFTFFFFQTNFLRKFPEPVTRHLFFFFFFNVLKRVPDMHKQAHRSHRFRVEDCILSFECFVGAGYLSRGKI